MDTVSCMQLSSTVTLFNVEDIILNVFRVFECNLVSGEFDILADSGICLDSLPKRVDFHSRIVACVG